MAVQATDALLINRGGVHFQTPASEVLAYVEGNTGTIYEAADIAARDAVTGLQINDYVHVVDASADGAITAGWARYKPTAVDGSGAGTAWILIQSEEKLNASGGGTNLAYTVGATSGTVTSDTGTDATIPVVDGTNAGLQVPADKAKVDFISVTQAVDLDAIETDAAASKVKTDFIAVTQAVDLDAIETNSDASKVKTDFLTVTAATDLDAIRTASHVAASTSGTATTNPVTIVGATQVVGFDIAALAVAP